MNEGRRKIVRTAKAVSFVFINDEFMFGILTEEEGVLFPP